MATIDIKLKSYDELIFEITNLNTHKYLLEQENKQLKKKYENAVADYEYEKCKNSEAIEYIKSYLPNYDFDHSNLKKLLEILGDKENE